MTDHIPMPDGSALVERRTHECGASVTLFRGVLWNDDDTPHDCGDNQDPGEPSHDHA